LFCVSRQHEKAVAFLPKKPRSFAGALDLAGDVGSGLHRIFLFGHFLFGFDLLSGKVKPRRRAANFFAIFTA
jgi:hypothetical protein